MNRRIKSLETLRQIEERGLTALARDLTQAQSAQAQALGRIDALDRRAVTEAGTSIPEAMPYIGRFLATLRREQSKERHVAAQLEGHIEGLRAQVIARFTSERTYGKLSEQLQQQILLERNRAAEAAMDDLTQSRFGR